MRNLLFPRLAATGMIKNRKFYLPYILSSVGTVMMYYIMHSLSRSKAVLGMVHGGDIGQILSLGKFVIAAFALIFLFYTNSFLIKRRYKEFGLYNILGMNRKNLRAIVAFESLFTFIISAVFGIMLGVAFSKLAELGLLNMTRNGIDYYFTVSWEAAAYTFILFFIIFLLLTAKSLITVSKTNPLELMQSAAVGEKPPKANWVIALLGVLILSYAYYLSVTINNPLSALFMFFAAVIMVIAATYMLFISGSVAVCRLLQKSKKYYYNKKHFIAVSSLTYRMKRNGAGLASICILCTMVLVMISTTASLYFGVEDSMRARYPRETEITVTLGGIENITDGSIEKIHNIYYGVFEKHGASPENTAEYHYATITGALSGDKLNPKADYDNLTSNYNDMYSVYFIDITDYNRAMNTDYHLSGNEAMLYTLRCKYDKKSIKIGDVDFEIAKKLDNFIEIGEANSLVLPSIMIVVPDYKILSPLTELDFAGDPMLSVKYYYGYDLEASDTEKTEIYSELCQKLSDSLSAENRGFTCYGGCLPAEKEDFYGTFGSLFFLGIILSILFIFAAAVIIYYKQISEGYEDEKRFSIMQNIGMAKADIKSTINSQILIVFFAPLIFAGLHLGFAFPFLWKILQMFNLQNVRFIILITAVTFVLFAAFYAAIYRITAKGYYNIVANDKTE